MVRAQQEMKLKCRDCDWQIECDPTDAKSCAEDHLNVYKGYESEAYLPNENHVVDGFVITSFAKEF